MRTKIYKIYKGIKDYKEEKGKLLKQQVFLSSYINKEYDNIDRMLLFHGIGSGKTCSSITIAETIMEKHPEMKVLVILPARLKTNFIDELISESCGLYKYISQDDYIKYTNKDTTKKEKNEIMKKFLKKIESNYEIISYETLRNIIMKSNDIQETFKKITKNKVIIIDEVHNLISSNINRNDINKILQENKINKKPKIKNINGIILRLLTIISQGQSNTKLFLLTATPIFDNYGQFIQLLLNLRPDLDETKIEVNPKHISKYINYLKGKISFFQLKDRSDYPSEEIDNIKIKMSDTQRRLIESIKNNKSFDDYFSDDDDDEDKGNMFCVAERQIAISSYNKAEKVFEDLDEYAPKLSKLFDLLELQGKHLIYSNFIKYCLELIAEYLESEGWSNYSKTNKIIPYRTFVLWDSKLKDDDKQQIKFILNSPDNMDGLNIRVILGSPSIKEGVSFKHIQHLHQLDPVWNSSAKTQIEGRCIRYKSHDNIPLNHEFLKRKVIIHNYILVSQDDDVDKNGNLNLTCDAKIYYEIIEKKRKIIKIIDGLLSKVAIDYYLWTKDDISPKSKSKSSIISVSKSKENDLINLLNNKKKEDKECPEGQILNPKTGRCVKITGKIGKKLIKGDNIQKNDIYTGKICLEWKTNKLRNPITKRAIASRKGVYNEFMKKCSHIKSPKLQ